MRTPGSLLRRNYSLFVERKTATAPSFRAVTVLEDADLQRAFCIGIQYFFNIGAKTVNIWQEPVRYPVFRAENKNHRCPLDQDNGDFSLFWLFDLNHAGSSLLYRIGLSYNTNPTGTLQNRYKYRKFRYYAR